MVSNYKKDIRCIIEFKRNIEKSNPKIANKLVGEIGEFYVLDQLEKKGFYPEHKGGQSGYDIYIKNINKRIEVRSSLLKNEGTYNPQDIMFYGWRVENRNQKKKIKFDIMVGVALDKTFTKPQFYIFTHKEAFSVDDINIPRFKNVKKKIHLFENKRSYKMALKSESAKPITKKYITKYEKYINEHKSNFLEKWDKLK